jgi:L-fucose mutarotase/ribose pyranase (RbsD/FucU family)
MARSPRLALSPAAIVLVTALVLAGCAGSDDHFVKNSDQGVYFKVPGDWRLYGEDAVIGALSQELSPQEEDAFKQLSWSVGFDAAPKPSIEHVGALLTEHPAGLARVERLGLQERDAASLSYLRNVIVPVDRLVELDESSVQVLEREDIEKDGFRGLRFVFNVRDPESDKFVTLNQVALLDSQSRQVYFIVVGCEARCYEENQGEIEKVIDSWTVKG